LKTFAENAQFENMLACYCCESDDLMEKEAFHSRQRAIRKLMAGWMCLKHWVKAFYELKVTDVLTAFNERFGVLLKLHTEEVYLVIPVFFAHGKTIVKNSNAASDRMRIIAIQAENRPSGSLKRVPKGSIPEVVTVAGRAIVEDLAKKTCSELDRPILLYNLSATLT